MFDTEPFEHIVIPSFFRSDVAEMIYKEFPETDDATHPWKHYHNPIKYKSTLNDFKELPGTRNVYEFLQSDQVVEILKKFQE